MCALLQTLPRASSPFHVSGWCHLLASNDDVYDYQVYGVYKGVVHYYTFVSFACSDGPPTIVEDTDTFGFSYSDMPGIVFRWSIRSLRIATSAACGIDFSHYNEHASASSAWARFSVWVLPPLNASQYRPTNTIILINFDVLFDVLFDAVFDALCVIYPILSRDKHFHTHCDSLDFCNFDALLDELCVVYALCVFYALIDGNKHFHTHCNVLTYWYVDALFDALCVFFVLLDGDGDDYNFCGSVLRPICTQVSVSSSFRSSTCSLRKLDRLLVYLAGFFLSLLSWCRHPP